MQITLTTYGQLNVGQAYRLPGAERWYVRKKNVRLTDEMREREVEIEAASSSGS